MQKGEKAVFRRKNGVDTQVGTANYAIYDAVTEAVSECGEAKCLEYINAQIRTNEMNRVRGLDANGPGKKALERAALAAITPAEWQSIAGDAAKIQALIDQKVAEAQAELDKSAEADSTEPAGAPATA